MEGIFLNIRKIYPSYWPTSDPLLSFASFEVNDQMLASNSCIHIIHSDTKFVVKFEVIDVLQLTKCDVCSDIASSWSESGVVSSTSRKRIGMQPLIFNTASSIRETFASRQGRNAEFNL